ncbi:TIGR04141 family sporadically distributed protein, partial [Chryseobacterium sp. 8AT]
MNTLNEDKNFKLAIYLIKTSYSTFKKCLKVGVSVDFYDFNKKIDTEGIVVVGKTKVNKPNWREFLQGALEKKLPDLNNSSNRAIVFFKISKRIFVIPFGYGKHLIKDEAIEREFGLRTTLNIINADKLISVDKANIGDMSIQTKTQTSKKGTPDVFNIDILRDLLKGITGEPENLAPEEIGNIVTGNEGLYVSPKTNIFKVPK